jgi:transposase-like protein
MDWRAALVEHGAVSGAVKVRRRRFYPVEKKPRAVEQTLGPGASAAQANGVNPEPAVSLAEAVLRSQTDSAGHDSDAIAAGDGDGRTASLTVAEAFH